jgi:hypothetical protein
MAADHELKATRRFRRNIGKHNVRQLLFEWRFGVVLRIRFAQRHQINLQTNDLRKLKESWHGVKVCA